MTREQFDKLSPEELSIMRQNILDRKKVKEEIKSIKEKLNPLYSSYLEISEQINKWLNDFNIEIDENKQEELFVKAEELKNQKKSIEDQIDELEKEKSIKDKELYDILTSKEYTMYIKFKNESVVNPNKLVVNKEEGIKVNDEEVENLKSKDGEKEPLSMRTARFFAKRYVSFLTTKEKVKNFVKEDVKKGYVYNKVQTKKENKLVIDRKKSALAKTTKKMFVSVRNTFYSAVRFGLVAKEKIVIKSTKLVNKYKANIEAKKDYKNEIKDINIKTKEAIEEYKKELEEKSKFLREQVANNYANVKADIKTL